MTITVTAAPRLSPGPRYSQEEGLEQFDDLAGHSPLTANYARQEVMVEGMFHPTNITYLKRGDGLRYFTPKLPVSILTIVVAHDTLLKGA